jgi:HAD superfamily hydrolase (TIGR01549 family)
MLALTHPLQAPVTWRVLSAFRKAQETLRGEQADGRGQAEIAARETGLTVTRVEGIVQEWMSTRPLKHLTRYRAAGLLPLLDFLASRGIKMGVFSDYPAALKLQALGVDGRFSLVLCSTDPDIGVFKPHPRGFLVAAKRWHLGPSEVLVVGDRLDADAAGAAAAGMPCVIVGGSQASPADSSGVRLVPSLERLRNVLDDDHRGQ